jgi:hypothetical protein
MQNPYRICVREIVAALFDIGVPRLQVPGGLGQPDT